MTNIINLDEVELQATFSIKGKEYKLLPMDSKRWLKWLALSRESGRIRRHTEILQKKAEEKDIVEDQLNVFEDNLAKLQMDFMDVQVNMITLILGGMSKEVAEQLSDVQRNKIMATMTKMMKNSVKDLKAEVGEDEPGESPKP